VTPKICSKNSGKQFVRQKPYLAMTRFLKNPVREKREQPGKPIALRGETGSCFLGKTIILWQKRDKAA